MQSKKMSMIEVVSNVAAGYAISVIANIYVLPWFGFNITADKACLMGAIFTVISIVRSYCFRRIFNRIREI